MSQDIPIRKIYGPPAGVASMTLCGLISALLGDGVWDVVSWIVLTVPLLLILWKCSKGRSPSVEESILKH